MLKICLDRNPKSRLLPEDILKSFFYNNKLEELIPFLEDDQETGTNEFTLNFVKNFLRAIILITKKVSRSIQSCKTINVTFQFTLTIPDKIQFQEINISKITVFVVINAFLGFWFS